jgi:hypothetical protein
MFEFSVKMGSLQTGFFSATRGAALFLLRQVDQSMLQTRRASQRFSEQEAC